MLKNSYHSCQKSILSISHLNNHWNIMIISSHAAPSISRIINLTSLVFIPTPAQGESVLMHARDISPMEADTAKVKKVDPS